MPFEHFHIDLGEKYSIVRIFFPNYIESVDSLEITTEISVSVYLGFTIKCLMYLPAMTIKCHISYYRRKSVKQILYNI